MTSCSLFMKSVWYLSLFKLKYYDITQCGIVREKFSFILFYVFRSTEPLSLISISPTYYVATRTVQVNKFSWCPSMGDTLDESWQGGV
jgi:hypothetical protein